MWTPDGSRIVWTSGTGGSATLYWQAADRSGSVEQLIKSPNAQYPTAFSRDGTRLVIREDAESRDLMVVVMDEEPRRVQPLITTPFVETSAEISPDGQLIAYASDETGQDEIYVRPFPDVNAGRWPVSIGGGAKPRWARNGRELFYLVQSGVGTAVMSASIERTATFAAGTPRKVLEGPYFFGTSGSGNTAFRTYDTSLDDQRFLMIKNPEGAELAATSTNITVIQNWTEELKRLVPTKVMRSRSGTVSVPTRSSPPLGAGGMGEVYRGARYATRSHRCGQGPPLACQRRSRSSASASSARRAPSPP